MKKLLLTLTLAFICHSLFCQRMLFNGPDPYTGVNTTKILSKGKFQRHTLQKSDREYSWSIELRLDRSHIIPEGAKVEIFLNSGEIIQTVNMKADVPERTILHHNFIGTRTKVKRIITVNPGINEESVRMISRIGIRSIRIASEDGYVEHVLKKNAKKRLQSAFGLVLRSQVQATGGTE